MNNEFIEVEVFEVYRPLYVPSLHKSYHRLKDGGLNSLGFISLSKSHIVSGEWVELTYNTYNYSPNTITKGRWFRREKMIEDLEIHTQKVKLYKTTMSNGNEYLTKEKLIGVNNE